MATRYMSCTANQPMAAIRIGAAILNGESNDQKRCGKQSPAAICMAGCVGGWIMKANICPILMNCN